MTHHTLRSQSVGSSTVGMALKRPEKKGRRSSSPTPDGGAHCCSGVTYTRPPLQAKSNIFVDVRLPSQNLEAMEKVCPTVSLPPLTPFHPARPTLYPPLVLIESVLFSHLVIFFHKLFLPMPLPAPDKNISSDCDPVKALNAWCTWPVSSAA